MIKFNWLKWLLYLVIALLTLEVLKLLVTKIPFSAAYLIAIILLCLQTLTGIGFLYYALFANIFKRMLTSRKLLLYFSISFVSFFALLETLFSFWLYHPTSIPPGLLWSYKYYYDAYNYRIMQYEKEAIAFDPQLLYTLRPGAQFRFRNAEFNTPVSINKYGFWDDDVSATAPEIICLGDSFTMGWGLNESESFPAIIERTTGKKLLNTGTPSYGTVRELSLMDRQEFFAGFAVMDKAAVEQNLSLV
jgi:hypothetical protein